MIELYIVTVKKQIGRQMQRPNDGKTAAQRYAENLVTLIFRLDKRKDMDVIEEFTKQENRTQHLRELVRNSK